METVGSSVVLALGPVAQQQGVLLVNTAAQNPNIRKIDNYVFSLVPLADRVMQTTAVYAVEGMTWPATTPCIGCARGLRWCLRAGGSSRT